MTDQNYMLQANSTGETRRGLDKSESDGRGSDRKKTGGSSEKAITKNAESFMQNVMRSLHLRNLRKVRPFMSHWNLAVIMAKLRHVQRRSLSRRSREW